MIGASLEMKIKAPVCNVKVAFLHTKRRVSLAGIKKLAQRILEGEKRFERLNIVFVDDKSMRKLNQKFTYRNSSTDVLSFDMRRGRGMGVECDVLGEVYVNFDRAKENAKVFGKKFEDEVKLLVIHGILHLLGYDHKGKKKALLMRKKEKQYLNSKKGK